MWSSELVISPMAKKMVPKWPTRLTLDVLFDLISPIYCLPKDETFGMGLDKLKLHLLMHNLFWGAFIMLHLTTHNFLISFTPICTTVKAIVRNLKKGWCNASKHSNISAHLQWEWAKKRPYILQKFFLDQFCAVYAKTFAADFLPKPNNVV